MNWNKRQRSDGPRRNKLYRNTEDKVVAGVCAGIADYFGFDVTITRVIVIVGSIFFAPTIPIVYVILALMLEKKPVEFERRREEDAELEKRIRSEPHATLLSVRHRFRDLDLRLQRIEKYVTSERFRLDREFEGLKD